MQINRRKNKISKRTATIAGLAIVAILVAISYISFSYKSQSNPATDTDPSRFASDKQQSDELAKNPDNKQATPNTDTPDPIKIDDQSKKGVVQLVAAANVSDGNVYIRGGVNNAVITGGSCYAVLTGPNNQTIKKDTTLLQNPHTTDCKTITMAASELSAGTWKVILYFTSDTLEGASNEVAITIS